MQPDADDPDLPPQSELAPDLEPTSAAEPTPDPEPSRLRRVADWFNREDFVRELLIGGLLAVGVAVALALYGDAREEDRQQQAQVLENTRFVRTAAMAEPGILRPFSGLDLAGAHLVGLPLGCPEGATPRDGDAGCTNLWDADLSGAVLWYVDLSGAVLAYADLSGANLWQADLSGAQIADADLTCADLGDEDLTCVDLRGADLTDADLNNADLTGAYAPDADLTGADLTGADLTDADLIGADLSGTNLSGTIMTDADLRNAELSDVDLSVPHWGDGACYFEAEWPEGYDPPTLRCP